MSFKCPLRLAAGLALLLALTPGLRAGSLDARVVALFPQRCSEFAYADLATARQLSWFVPFEMQAMPVRFYRFENFIDAPQMGIGNQVLSVAWALAPGDKDSAGGLIGVAVGQFDRQTAESYLNSRNTPSLEFEGYTLYASGSDFGDADLLFAFMDSDTIVFGPRALVQDVIRVHGGEEASLDENSQMIALIDQENGDGVFWGAFTSAGAREAIQRLVPDAAKFPQGEQWIGKITAVTVSVERFSDMRIEVNLKAVAASASDALVLSQLFQAGLLIKRYQASQGDPNLAEIFDGVTVGAKGAQIVVSLELTKDQVVGLIQRQTFLLPGM